MTSATSAFQTTAPRIPKWTIGERLRKAREDAGFNQELFAAETGISKRKIIYLEQGARRPGRGDLLLWQLVTAVPIEWILEDSDGPDSSDPQPSH